MTHHIKNIVPISGKGEEKPSFKEQIEQKRSEHRERVLDYVKQMMLLFASIGQESIVIDSLPGINHKDARMCEEWLKKEGVKVRKKFMSGVVEVFLEPEDSPKQDRATDSSTQDSDD